MRRFGPGIPALAAGTQLASYFLVEMLHDAEQPDVGDLGMHRFGLEVAIPSRVLSPQIEEFPVNMHGVCNGGNHPRDSPVEGAAGFWCYDQEGTSSMFTLIDQAADIGVEMIIFGIDMNNTWRTFSFRAASLHLPSTSLLVHAPTRKRMRANAGLHTTKCGFYMFN